MYYDNRDFQLIGAFRWCSGGNPDYVLRNAQGHYIKRGDLHGQIAALCARWGRCRSPNNGSRVSSAKVGERTAYARRRVLHALVDDLHRLGYKVQDIRHLKQKHFKALTADAFARDVAPKTLQTVVSHWRTLAAWIGKPDVVPPNDHLLPQDYLRVPLAAQADKSWRGQGVNWEEVVVRVRAIETWVADVLEAERRFGLRMSEALQMRVQESDLGESLWIYRGTKGGRARHIPIRSADERVFLDQLKATRSVRQSLAPQELTLKQATGRYYRVIRKVGISRKALGVTSHGLRHERLQELYESETGVAAPIAGGQPVEPVLDRAARLAVAETAGHNRMQISGAYLGAILSKRTPS